MNLVEFCEQLVVDIRRAVVLWGQGSVTSPLGTPEIRMPVARLEVAVVKLREACWLLQECTSVITVLDWMAEAAYGNRDAKAELSFEARRRISGRVRAIAERMMRFPLVGVSSRISAVARALPAVDPTMPPPDPPTPASWNAGEGRQEMEEFGRELEDRVKVDSDPHVPGRVNITIPNPELTAETKEYIRSRIRERVDVAIETQILKRPLTVQEVVQRPWSPELTGEIATIVRAREARAPMTREAAIRIARENFIKYNADNLMPPGTAVWSASEWVIQAILESSK